MSNPFALTARFMRRSHSERRLLIAQSLLFVSAHVLLRFASLQRTRERLRGLAVCIRAKAEDPQQLTWSADRIGAVLPGRHSCLIHALACDAAAASSGIPVEFRIGAARGAKGHRFHAWLEHRGTTIVGHGHADFVAFAQF